MNTDVRDEIIQVASEVILQALKGEFKSGDTEWQSRIQLDAAFQALDRAAGW